MELLLIIAFACAGISFTITWTSLFKPIREALGALHPKVDELLHCPWCFNHYVSAAAILLFYPVEAHSWWLFVNWFAIISIGGLVHYVLLRAYEPVAEMMMHRKIEKLKEKEKQEQE